MIIPETVSSLLVLLSSGPSRYYMIIFLPSENIACRNTNTKVPNEIGRACSTCGGEERRIQGFGGET